MPGKTHQELISLISQQGKLNGLRIRFKENFPYNVLSAHFEYGSECVVSEIKG